MREELEIERVVIHAKALEKRGKARQEEQEFFDKAVLDSISKEEVDKFGLTKAERDAVFEGKIPPSLRYKINHAWDIDKEAIAAMAIPLTVPIMEAVVTSEAVAGATSSIEILASRVAARLSAIGKPIHKNPIYLRYKPGTDRQAFDRKVDELQKLGREYKLKVTRNVNSDPRVRWKFRQQALRDIEKQHGDNPKVVEKLRDNMRDKLDADHRQDLQIGGKDLAENLDLLDRSVNRSLGPQIRNQIKDLPEGTIITNIQKK